MLNFNNIMIGSDNTKIMGEFYKKVFDADPDMEDDGWYGWLVGNTYFSIGEHSEIKGKSKEPQRIIINFESDNVKEEYNRIKKIEGVKIVKEPYEMQGAWIATFEDPDGNYFQLMSPWKENKD